MLQVNQYYSPSMNNSFNKRELKANIKMKKFVNSNEITKEEKQNLSYSPIHDESTYISNEGEDHNSNPSICDRKLINRLWLKRKSQPKSQEVDEVARVLANLRKRQRTSDLESDNILIQHKKEKVLNPLQTQLVEPEEERIIVKLPSLYERMKNIEEQQKVQQMQQNFMDSGYNTQFFQAPYHMGQQQQSPSFESQSFPNYSFNCQGYMN